MSDLVDDAQAQIERDLERSLGHVLAAAEPSRASHATHCRDCGEDLEPHRKPWGLCVPCKSIREARDRQRAVGV